MLLIISSLTHCESLFENAPNQTYDQPLENFTKCPSDAALRQQFSELMAQSHRTEKIVAALLERLNQAEQRSQNKLEQRQESLAAELEFQQAQEELFHSLPWYARYSINVYTIAAPWIVNELWPTMQRILTSMIAHKLVSEGLTGMDNVTGRIPLISFRFGESLTMNEGQKDQAKAERLLKKDPELARRTKELQQLDKDTLRFRLKKVQEENLQTLYNAKTAQNLEKYPNYQNVLQEVRDLEHEINAFVLVHDLFKKRDELQRRKADILQHAEPTSSNVHELPTEEKFLSQFNNTNQPASTT